MPVITIVNSSTNEPVGELTEYAVPDESKRFAHTDLLLKGMPLGDALFIAFNIESLYTTGALAMPKERTALLR